MLAGRNHRLLQIVVALAAAVLLASVFVVRQPLREARATLADRQASALAVQALKHACSRGYRPNEEELVAVATLFPDARLTCVELDDSICLTFADPSLSGGQSPLVAQMR